MRITSEVQRIEPPSTEEFQRVYVSRNQPVIINHIARNWPALSVMNPEMIKRMFGQLSVPVRDSDNELDYFFGQSAIRKMKLADYIDAISDQRPPGRRPPYLGNISFDNPQRRRYLHQLKAMLAFPDYFPTQIDAILRLWMGAEGQRSTIHNDNYHNLNAQLHGRKKYLLFSPDQYTRLYTRPLNKACWASPIDPESPDYRQYPLFESAEAVEAVLEAGDMLYIPIFWWHYVFADTLSISVSRFSHLGETRYWEQTSP